MRKINEYVSKTDVFRTLRQNAIKDKKDVHVRGIKDGEKFKRIYRYSPKSKKWFIKNDDGSYTKIKSNVPASDVRNLLFKGFTFDTMIEEDNIILISFTENIDIEESTTTASVGGAYQTPFGGQTIKIKKMNENNIVEITESQFNEMVKKVLAEEFVYGSEAGKATNKNKGATKSTAKQQTKKADDNQQPNISDKETATYYKKSNPVARDEDKKENLDTEAHQNGMEDLEYDNLPDQAKEQIKKGFEEGGDAGEKLLDQAKKRAKSKDQIKEPLVQMGGDIELSKKKAKNKPTVAESVKKYKLKNKVVLTEEEDLEMFLEQKENKLKGKTFFLEDFTGNIVKIDWTTPKAKVLSHRNIVKEAKQKDTLKRLMSSVKKDTKKSVNESNYFDNFYKKMKGKKIVSEDIELSDEDKLKRVSYEFKNLESDFKMIARAVQKKFNIQHLNTWVSSKNWGASGEGYYFDVMMSFNLNSNVNFEDIKEFISDRVDDFTYYGGPGRPYLRATVHEPIDGEGEVLFEIGIDGGMDV